MKFLNFPLILLLFLAMGVNLSAQRNCGSMEYLEMQQQQDPKRALKLKQIDQATNAIIANGAESVMADLITIPVVFHVVYRTATENISTAQIQSQLDVLNDDFRRLNADADNVWGQAADTDIEFCLATVDPNGGATTGITRTSTTVNGFGTNDAVKFAAQGGHDAWPADQYMNFWVCNIGGGILGYAQFPGGPVATDGVVCGYEYTGTTGTATAPFDLGRTATHEVGHWLNLRHIWGDGGCGVDDFVADTPESDASNFGCALGHVSCGSVDMVQNYMDYSDDACMNLFTQGQTDRMRAIFDTDPVKEGLLTSPGCGTPAPPTCDDGIQNQGETGVDCGGPCPGICPTCDDGIQNQGETGVDCGGPNCVDCPCTDNEIILTINLDNYPQETSWEVEDANGNIVASGGTYPNQPDGSTVTENLCLGEGCYDFTMFDSFGDGICCTYGIGSYSLTDADGGVLASGDAFGTSETTNFCLDPAPTCDDGIQNGEETDVDCGGPDCPACPTCTDGIQNGGETGVDCGGPDCPPCAVCPGGTLMTVTIILDDYPGETSWTINDADAMTVASGGTYGNEAPGTTIMEMPCLPDGCYTFTMFDSFGDGICCDYGNGSYSVDANGVNYASGGLFTSAESTVFCIGDYTPPTCDDGIQNGDETGVDCGGSCVPCNMQCVYENLDRNGFDNGWGIWNDGGSDCRRNINDAAYASSGSYCVRLRDNTATSTTTTDNLDFTIYDEATVSFTYITTSMETGEDFWLQVSTDGGASYTTVAAWVSGTDFANDVREYENVVIPGGFSANTSLRFRCDASNNNDRVYLDDVIIKGCYNGNSTIINNAVDGTTREIETTTDAALTIVNMELFPNPVSDRMTVKFKTSKDAALQFVMTDMTGKVVQQQQLDVLAGKQTTELNASELSQGIYFLHIISGNDKMTKKFVVVR